MSRPPEDTPEGTIHRLDTRLGELGAGLRRLFAPVLDEEIPPELAALTDALEQRLNGAVEEGGAQPGRVGPLEEGPRPHHANTGE